jgi:hypothetical protein
MPQDESKPFARTQIRQPIPGEDAFDADYEAITGGRDGCETRCGASRHVAVHQHLALLVQDTEVQGAGMEIDAAGKWVLLGVESHEVSSSSSVFASRPAYHGGMWRRGPQ